MGLSKCPMLPRCARACAEDESHLTPTRIRVEAVAHVTAVEYTLNASYWTGDAKRGTCWWHLPITQDTQITSLSIELVKDGNIKRRIAMSVVERAAGEAVFHNENCALL